METSYQKRYSSCVAYENFKHLEQHKKGNKQSMHPLQHCSKQGFDEMQRTKIPTHTIISDNEAYALSPRKKMYAIHNDQSISHQLKLFTNDDKEHVLHTKRVNKNDTKKQTREDVHHNSLRRRKPQKTKDTTSSSKLSKAWCLLDFLIASYLTMYEYFDKNNFENGMQLLGATNKANIRKQYVYLLAKLQPNKDQTNIYTNERFALLFRAYEMLQKVP